MEPRQNGSVAQLPHEEDEIIFSESSNPDSSGVLMSAEPDSKSDDESEQPDAMATDQLDITRHPPKEPGTGRMTIVTDEASKKRKSFEAATGVDSDTLVSHKKMKREGVDVQSPSPNHSRPDFSLLPAEIWHRIFTFTPPRTLGNLMMVNKLFSVYLDPSSPFHLHIPHVTSDTHATFLKPDILWQSSRRRFWPRMPSPLQRNTELSMWQLACQTRCQFCGKPEPTDQMPTTDQWHSGPGADGVKVIWTFAVKSCGPCLLTKTIKEVDLLLSPSIPSILLPGLPFVFVTNEMHVLTPDVLQGAQVHPGVQLTKMFLRTSVDQLADEFNLVKSLGGATGEEWLKGLEYRGKERRSDSSRWEKWAAANGVAAMRTLLYPGVSVAVPSTDASLVSAGTLSPANSLQDTHKITPVSCASASSSTVPTLPTDLREIVQRPQPSTKPSIQHGKTRVRTRQEVLEMKAARRTEIERRAMELQPPLTANVLAYIPSFQAALQIISPLDGNAWELLKPRLLAQRAQAERREARERDIAAHARRVQERSQDAPSSETTSVETKQLIDKNWDDAQAPLRTQISEFADEIIRDGWDQGRKVNRKNCPRFAVDVLLYVRKRFYSEVAKDAAAARAAGQEPVCDAPEGPFTQKLTLENMKWIFDVKIKPHTESFRKELFFCKGCEGNTKIYGFEGVVQHYAAKHTGTLSRGSIVVHWRAEWPEIPPFKPDPQPGRDNNQAQPHPQYALRNYETASSVSHQPTLYNPPSAGYGQLASWDYNVPQQLGPISNRGSVYNPQTPLYPPLHSLAGEYLGPQGPYPGTALAPPPAYSPVGNTPYSHNYQSRQANPQLNLQPANSPSQGDMFWLQLEDLARSSRDLWTTTAGLKEIPGSLRVHVVIFHVAKKFRYKFSHNPSLTMFIHGLSNNKDMRPVRNVNGLVCKACKLGLGNGAPPGEERISFSLPQLVSHFQRKHIELLQAVGAQLLDWVADMVFTPEISSLPNIRTLPGMDGQKFALFCEAFPELQYHGNLARGVVSMHMNSVANQEPHNAARSSAHKLPAGLVANDHQAQTLPAIHHTASAEDLSNAYDSKPPGPQSYELVPAIDRRGADTLDSNEAGAESSATPRVSAENWTSSSSTKLRSRNTEGKERQTYTSKIRKGSKKLSTPGARSGTAGELDQVAEEEQRRQEEEIRAMWAADRAEAARLASSITQPHTENEEHAHYSRPSVASLENCSPQPPTGSHYPTHSAPAQTCPGDGAVDLDEEDLTADLVSYLNRQEASPNNRVYHSKPENDPTHPVERRSSPRPHYIYVDDEGHSHELRRTKPSDRAYYEPRAPPGQYRQRSPIVYYPRDTYEPGLPPAAYHGVEYEQSGQLPHQGYHRAYVNRPREVSPRPYAGPYELVLVRDSRGEYYIRRPIRRDSAQPHLTYENDRPLYIETRRTYEHNLRSEGSVYETISRVDSPPREPTYLTPGRAKSIAPQPGYESFSGHDPAECDEDDPRYPMVPPSLNTARRC